MTAAGLTSVAMTPPYMGSGLDAQGIQAALQAQTKAPASRGEFANELQKSLDAIEDAQSDGDEAIAEGREILERHQEAIKEFEAMFASLMIKELRNTANGLFEGDSTDSLGALFDQHMGQEMAKGGGLGVASQLNRYLEIQHQARNPSEPQL